MKARLSSFLGIFLLSLPTHGALRSSSTYSIQDTNNNGGAPGSSANYVVSGNAVGEAGNSPSYSSSYRSKNGFVAQLYEVVGFVIDANPTTIVESGNLQLIAAHLLDDATRLASQPSDVNWSIVSGPLVSVTLDGVVTADVVYANTNANVLGTYGSSSSSLLLTVLNTNPDNFPGYSGDGIDDDWQVQYFGLPPNPNAAPNVDADGSGLGNLFKFVAGLNPLDRSRFRLTEEVAPNDSSRMILRLQPVMPGRTYTIQATASAVVPVWAPLASSSYTDEGNLRTVIDYNPLPGPKFYRVQISKP